MQSLKWRLHLVSKYEQNNLDGTTKYESDQTNKINNLYKWSS